MIAPRCCPVCGQNSIQPVVRSAVVRIEGQQNPITEALAYRCSNGHLFLIGTDGTENDSTKPVRS